MPKPKIHESPIVLHSRTSKSDSFTLCADDWVIVRSKKEILATLDGEGRLAGVPFMPEMLAWCDRSMRVYKRAHKTCDYVTDTGLRALPNTVHLVDARCSGANHGGCEARCLLYWKQDWLRPVSDGAVGGVEAAQAERSVPASVSESTLNAACTNGGSGDALRYVCQATLVPNFTTKLPWWNLRQFAQDVQSGNVATFREMVPFMLFRAYDNLVNLGVGLGRPLRWLYNRFQSLRGGRPYPTVRGAIPVGSRTPALSLGLQRGERVRVKSHAEILKTIDDSGRNRGMTYSAEMAAYCGNEYRVLDTVSRLVDEKTGKLIELRNPCVILDGVICAARNVPGLLFCPKATYPYWREIWLERIGESGARADGAPSDIAT